MLYKEAIWIGQNLNALSLKNDQVVLNFGSQNIKYNSENGFILKHVINPIKEISQVRNLDLQSGKDIVYSGDLLNDDFFYSMSSIQFDCILLCNVLEHVDNIEKIVQRISKLVKCGGYILFSGPFEFPLHYDPIDNGFRPDVKAVLNLFPDFKLIKGEIVTDQTDFFYISRSIKKIVFTILRILTPFYKYSKWQKVILPRLRWLNKKFKVTCVIMEKTQI